jgi:hypothetical protein
MTKEWQEAATQRAIEQKMVMAISFTFPAVMISSVKPY